MANGISNDIFNRILDIGDTNIIKYRSVYSKILLKTKVKGLGHININKKYRKYKDFY